MNTQISLKLPNKLFKTAKEYAEAHGYNNLQEFIRETVREKIFENEEVGGKLTSIASEKSLARNWLSVEEDKAWAHLQGAT